MVRIIHKAKPGDYPAYAEMYMKLLPDDGRILEQLAANFQQVRSFISALPQDKLNYRYRQKKWSIKETLLHIIDDERIFSCRALRFARNEKQNLVGFDQDSYAVYSGAGQRTLDSLFEEYEAVRKSTIALFQFLPEDSLDRMGQGTGTFNNSTVRALVYHIAGHEMHHLNIIKEKYL